MLESEEKKAVVHLPDWQHAELVGNRIDISEAEHILIDGSGLIPQGAFHNCTRLKTVEIADEVSGLDKETFVHCTSLIKIRFGKGVRNIGDSSFGGCNQLEEIKIPGNIKSIGQYAFLRLQGLKKLTLEEGLESIGHMSFHGCSNLETVISPAKGIIDLVGSVLGKTKWIENNPEEFVMIGETLLSYKGNEKNRLTIPDNVKLISPGAFRFRSFRELDLGKGVKRIGNNAFEGNKNLETVIFHEGLTEIGDYAFNGCLKLRGVKAPESLLIARNYTLQAADMADCPTAGCVYAGKAVIGCIGNQKRVVIKEGSYSINSIAFSGKYKLETIIFPESIRIIFIDAFKTCTHLSFVVIPRGVPASCLKAFAGIPGIKILTWAGSEAEAFAKDNNIQVELLDENLSQEEILKLLSQKKRSIPADNKEEPTHPSEAWFCCSGNAISSISSKGLKEMEKNNISSITLPVRKDGKMINRVMQNALSYLGSVPCVEELIIPDTLEIKGVTTRPAYPNLLFPKCNTIKLLVFSGNTQINFYLAHQSMFMDTIESLKIEHSDRFKSVNGVVYSEDGKALVYYPRSRKNKKYTVLPGTEKICPHAFCNVKYLEDLVFCDGLKTISSFACMKSSLKNVVIPGSVDFIAEKAFSSCNLKSLILNDGVRFVVETAFWDCITETAVIPDSVDKADQILKYLESLR